jgi:photosystem II stability/assembly factor-like uncharacterized protein
LKRLFGNLVLWVAIIVLATPAAHSAQKKRARAEVRPAGSADLSKAFEGLKWRQIGPFRGGRSVAVTGVRGAPLTFYFGGTGGGVWKTTDAGVHWSPVSDKDFKTGSVGALAVSESDPNIVYAGMGESPIRGNVSYGDGVYRSTDGGKSWTNVGLKDTQQISRVRIDPKNPDVVFVAALGHVWGPNKERGIYRSTDGGKSWKQVLYVNDLTGASDLAMDPNNPRILYAGFWEVYRKPWTLESGGTHGGLYKTTDGGDTWKKLSGGLPKGLVGRVGVSVSGADSNRVYAIVEAKDGGVFRSDDGGQKWTRVNSENKLRQRAWYYTWIYADPKSVDTVYAPNVGFWVSHDGGKAWSPIRPPHGDNHDMWIDPDNPQRLIASDDGGATISLDGGKSWSTEANQPTAQVYRVATDDQVPYRVYGPQQDNTAFVIASAGYGGAIDRTDWFIPGGCESGYVLPKPGDPNIVYGGCYGGSIEIFNLKNHQSQDVVAWPQLAIGQAAKDLKYRFQWNAPIATSPHDPNIIYHAAQKLLESRDAGRTWKEISPDLTRNDKGKQGLSGGPITKDNTGIEVYDVIFYVVESPHAAGTIWVGTDDGLVQLTRDGGAHWENVTPKGMPEWIQVNAIDVSPEDAGTAYVAATMYKFDDYRPYIYKTHDYGKTWTKIVDGIPDGAFSRVVREDPVRRGLLYAGTETGMYVSFDDGAHWQPFQLNLPVVSIQDLTVHGNDLVAATQGRAIWILDDLSPLRQWSEAIGKSDAHLFKPAPALRLSGYFSFFGGGLPRGLAVGANPPIGAVINYWVKPDEKADEKAGEKADEKHEPTVKMAFLDGTKVIRSFTSEKKKGEEAKAGEAGEDEEEPGEKPLEVKPGLNRFVWDLRIAKAQLLPHAVIWGSSAGPRVPPGTYSVRLTVGEKTLTEPVVVQPDPNVPVSAADLAKQFEYLRDVRDRLTETHQTVARIRDVKTQIKEAVERAKKAGQEDAVKARAAALTAKLDAIEDKLVNPRIKANEDMLNFVPALDYEFVGLTSVVDSADAAPRAVDYEYYNEAKTKLQSIEAELATVLDKDVADFDSAVRAANVPAVVVAPVKEEKD